MRIASIDIGTNSILLLIADIDDKGNIHPIEHQQRFPRLGKEIDKKYIISESAFDTVVNVLNEYKNISKQHEVDTIIACATSAVRDSLNKNEFIRHLKKATSIKVEIISGKVEAFLTYKGAFSGVSSIDKQFVVLDIGGGSTEISFMRDNKFLSHSLQIGAVRLTERYVLHNPMTRKESQIISSAISTEYLRIKRFDFSNYILVGVAGTVTTLACLDQNLPEFDIQLVSGYRLSRDSVEYWSNKLISMTSSEIRSLSKTTEGREDILSTGVLILNEFIKHFQIPEIIISERGLRYGLALREWEKENKA